MPPYSAPFLKRYQAAICTPCAVCGRVGIVLVVVVGNSFAHRNASLSLLFSPLDYFRDLAKMVYYSLDVIVKWHRRTAAALGVT